MGDAQIAAQLGLGVPPAVATRTDVEGESTLLLGPPGQDSLSTSPFTLWERCASAHGHDVHIIDNLSRRKIDLELEVESLTPIQSMGVRLDTWSQVSGKQIQFSNINVAEQYHRLLQVIKDFKPDAIVHFAEQRAAPYSMKGSREKRYTVDNNLSATNNVLAAIVESGQDIHLVHLGTMGVYGYTTANLKLPEGYLRVHIPAENGEVVERDILYPADPGSIYHMTKTQDQLFFYFYNKNDGIRVTDLHQGIVWGTQTEETEKDVRLINRFDYDGDYGTVLNRFLMQAAVGYPLTVHGTGGQTRAFIHIRDTVQCIRLAMENDYIEVQPALIWWREHIHQEFNTNSAEYFIHGYRRNMKLINECVQFANEKDLKKARQKLRNLYVIKTLRLLRKGDFKTIIKFFNHHMNFLKSSLL